MPKFTIKRPDPETYKGWGFVLVAGTVLALLAVIDLGGLGGSGADGSTGCVMVVRVNQDVLNVREEPSVDSPRAGSLANGDRVDATTLVRNGFRRLEDGRWASEAYLAPEPGSRC